MSNRSLIVAAVVLSFGAAGVAHSQSSTAPTTPSTTTSTTPAPATPTTPPEQMRGSTTQNNPATATPPPGQALGTAPDSAGSSASTTGNNAVNTSSEAKPGAPVAGANSFTEGQARSRMEGSGFSQVSELQLDNQGVWRAKAMKDGKSLAVAMDFQGNVVGQ